MVFVYIQNQLASDLPADKMHYILQLHFQRIIIWNYSIKNFWIMASCYFPCTSQASLWYKAIHSSMILSISLTSAGVSLSSFSDSNSLSLSIISPVRR